MTTQTKVWQVDCGASYEGAATTTITGLDHLEGESLAVLADGVSVGPKTVTDGEIELDTAASKVIVGFAYTSRVKTLPPDVGAPDGTAYGRPKRVSEITAHLVESGAGVQFGPDEDRLKTLTGLTEGELNTIDASPKMPGGYGDGQVVIEMSEPLPMYLAAVSYDVSPGD